MTADKKKKILILYNSVGLGHKSIAENIAFYLQDAGLEVRLEDVLQVEHGRLSRGGERLYRFFLSHAPWIWNFLYRSSWVTNLLLGYRTKVAAKHSSHVLKIINDFRPDMAIATHTNASAILTASLAA